MMGFGFGTIAVVSVIGGTFYMLLLDFRRSPVRAAVGYYILLGLGLLTLWFIDRDYGSFALVLWYTPLIHLPSYVYGLLTGRARGWQLLFVLLSCIFFSQLILQIGDLADMLTDWDGEEYIAAVLVAAAFGFIIVKWLRPLFAVTFTELRRGWWLPCGVIIMYYLICIFLLPVQSRLNTVLRPAMALLMLGCYALEVYVFIVIRGELVKRHAAELATVQISGLHRRLDSLRENEEQVRMERHNLRHRLTAASELLRQGNTEAVLELLGDAERNLDEAPRVRWCVPPVLDAMFGGYFVRAERAGIEVEADLKLPEKLPVDENELAMVVANALENAVNGCRNRPEGERRITCRAIALPKPMFEITNTCDPKLVRFNVRGQPVTDEPGHGLGVQSITNFCDRYNAAAKYSLKDGVFSFRLIL